MGYYYKKTEKWISIDRLIVGQAVSRRYRNRRIGEFLKEIDLSEKKSTGITKILRSLESNGSPPPVFETDEDRNYFIVTIHQHESFANMIPKNVQDNVLDIVPVNVLDKTENNVRENKVDTRRNSIIELLLADGVITMSDLAKALNVSIKTIQRDLDELRNQKRIERIGSDTSGYWKVLD